MQRLAIIGAGPKAIAIGAKASALRRMGVDAPEVVVFEQFEPFANWRGRLGYTDGEQRLGTPPDKDVGFPYSTTGIDAFKGIDQEMLSFSWMAHLLEEQSAGMSYDEWIDQGR